jgi:hypothetical protein
VAEIADDFKGGGAAMPMASLKSLSVRGAVEKQLMLPLKVANIYSS